MPVIIMVVLLISLCAGIGLGLLHTNDQTPSTAKVSVAKKLSKPAVDTHSKKARFVATLLPEIKQANARIQAARETVKAFTVNDDLLINDTYLTLTETYNIADPENIEESIASLLKKVDVLPASLVLAQGANESAWGESRFAKKANNYFGMWCYTKGCGLVPTQRSEGKTHEVARYQTITASVEAYMLNLNRNAVYQALRDTRYHLKAAKKIVGGCALASTLHKYSERGSAYTDTLCQMIKFNKWAQFDQ